MSDSDIKTPNEPFAIVIDRLYEGQGPSLAYWNGESYQFSDGDCFDREGDTLDGNTAEFLTDYQLEKRLFGERDCRGEPVAMVRHFQYSGVARNDFTQEAVLIDGGPGLPDGTLLYTSPHTAERRLDAPAQVGNRTFRENIEWSTVIEAAQRHYKFMRQPELDHERIKKGAEAISNIFEGQQGDE